MIYYLIKVAVTTLLVVLVSEVARRSTLYGALLASIPLVSVLAMVWLYLDTGSIQQVSRLSQSIFWMVLPSLSLFLLLPWLLRAGLSFFLALPLSLGIMIGCYLMTLYLCQRWGLSL